MDAKEKGREKERKGIAPWQPFSEMARWERGMERTFDDFFGRRLRPLWGEHWWPVRDGGIGAPVLDLYEEKDEIVAKVELAGLEKDDIEVHVSDHLLTIKGEKKKEEETKRENFYRLERSYGSFSRTVDLPAEVQGEKARASFKNGVLEIRLPKSEEAKKKETRVKVE
jgi:HSP20 family protein